MNTDAAAKIRMLESSLRCFVCGLLGLLPVIGFPFAFAALVLSGKVRAGQRKYWNAARPYWVCGVISAIAALIFWGLIAALIVYRTVAEGPCYYGSGSGDL
jgi:hypothetical protein